MQFIKQYVTHFPSIIYVKNTHSTTGISDVFTEGMGGGGGPQFDTMQSHILCLSLSSICINLTFSNLVLLFPVNERTAVACWLGCLQSMNRERGAYYGSPWMHFSFKGDRHAALKHGLLWFGDQDLLFLVNELLQHQRWRGTFQGTK